MRRVLACLASTAIAVGFVFACGVDTTGTPLAPSAPDTSTPDTQPSLPPVADAPIDTYDGFFPDPTPGFNPQHVDKKYLRLAEAPVVDVVPGATIKIVTSVPPTLDGVPSAALVHDPTNDVVIWTVKSFKLQGNPGASSWGRVRVTGPKALVIVSQGDVTIEGVLSGYSDEDELGPGGVAAKAAQDGAGRSGGGGGGNGSVGGTGGPSAAEATTPGGEIVAKTTKLQGGVAGGRGGNAGTPPNRCGGGGAGGGALQISTMGKIVVGAMAGIDVGGGGGRGGCPVTASGGGGGGGGSGGVVQLEAIGTIELLAQAQIAAMGGGGGEGGCVGGGGNNGEPAPFTPTTSKIVASGGIGSCAGVGGAGAGVANGGAGPGSLGGLTYGGGGGGGAYGKVWLRTRGTTPTVANGTIVGVVVANDMTF